MSPRLRYLSTTLTLVVVGLGYALVQGWPARSTPHLEKSAAAAQPPASPLPTARQMLDREAELSLTPDQKGRLLALDAKWRQESAPLLAALEAAEQEFSRFMNASHAGGKVSLQEIQPQSADYRELSAELRELRRRQAGETAEVLTQSQQRTLVLLTSPHTRGGVQ